MKNQNGPYMIRYNENSSSDFSDDSAESYEDYSSCDQSSEND